MKNENKVIKNRIPRDIGNFLEHEEVDYYKLERVNNFWSSNYIYMHVVVTEKHYQLKNILIKVDHT